MSAAAAASSDLEPEIPFRFGWEEAMATDLAFAVFAWVYLLDSPWDYMGEAGEENMRGGGRCKSDYDTNNMEKRTAWGNRYPAEKTAAAGGVDYHHQQG